MPINLDKWDLGGFGVGNESGIARIAWVDPKEKAVEHIKKDDYKVPLERVGNTALSFSEREKAVAQLKNVVTGERRGCLEYEYIDGPGKGKTVCIRHGYFPVHDFAVAPSSPNFFVLKFAGFFSNDTVQRVKDLLSRGQKEAETVLSTAKGGKVKCEVDESFHYQAEIVCKKVEPQTAYSSGNADDYENAIGLYDW